MTRIALLALFLMSCSPQALTPAGSVAPSGARAQVSPVATAGLGVASCRLPVVSWYQPGNAGNVYLPDMGVQAHQVAVPDGVVSTSAADQFTNGNDGFGWRSSSAPVLRGTGPVGYYDAAARRFLPVPRAQVSPDGRRYTYMDYTQGGLYSFGRLHVVDVATGLDRAFDLPAAEYEIFDFSAAGIYFNYGPYAQDAGLLLLNPDSGAIRQVFPDGYVMTVADGQAWLTVNELDLHPTSQLPGGEGNAVLPTLNVVQRRDLKSGQVTEWFRQPLTAPGFQLLGVYGGAPALLVYLAVANDPRWSTGQVPYEVLLVSRPAVPTTVSAGISTALQLDAWYQSGRSGLGISDSHGIWLGGQAIYLYQPAHGMTKIATFPGFPANGCL